MGKAGKFVYVTDQRLGREGRGVVLCGSVFLCFGLAVVQTGKETVSSQSCGGRRRCRSREVHSIINNGRDLHARGNKHKQLTNKDVLVAAAAAVVRWKLCTCASILMRTVIFGTRTGRLDVANNTGVPRLEFLDISAVCTAFYTAALCLCRAYRAEPR